MIYINIDKDSDETLIRQVYNSMKAAILQGKLHAQEKLPSSRELAKQLDISRNVVIEAYEQLHAEGYLESKKGSGTYVCEGVVFEREQKRIEKIPPKIVALSEHSICFRTGIPELREIPIKKWGQTYQKIILDIEPSKLDYQDCFGDSSLRQQISDYLNRARGASTQPENIMITNGAAQSFSLLCQLISKEEYALVEDPLSYGILNTLKSNHVDIHSIELDQEGIQTLRLPKKPPKLIFTTPSHQFPTGVVLPAKRRIQLLQYARMNKAYVVEDDYDSEFRFDGNPIHSMQHLDPESVIYVGTFSKTFMPSLRIGYMVMPQELCQTMRELKYVADLHSPILEQLTMAEFIESGQLERHIRRMGKLYRSKRDMLIQCLKEAFGEQIEISGANAGLHFVATFPQVKIDHEILDQIASLGVQIGSMKKHELKKGENSLCDHSLLMGYGNLHKEDIKQGVLLLASVIKR